MNTFVQAVLFPASYPEFRAGVPHHDRQNHAMSHSRRRGRNRLTPQRPTGDRGGPDARNVDR